MSEVGKVGGISKGLTRYPQNYDTWETQIKAPHDLL